jgi:alkylation response protein AidB-like acyl-CoA dehydrogenase
MTSATAKRRYPAGREDKRRVLLEAVESIADLVQSHADESEAIGTLAPTVVEAMSSSGLFGLKLPAELGGAEADPVTQIEVIERMTYLDTSAGWATMIGATSVGWPGAFLPNAGVARVFAGGRVPTCAGSGGVLGTAEEAPGGYRVTGRFPFASGIRHAEWLIGGARIARGDGEPSAERFFVIPAGDAVLHEDTWDVAGLRGTGSNDFSVTGLFVPSEMTWDRGIMMRGEPERGGPIFRLGMPAFTSNEHTAFSLGAARRALDLVGELAQSKKRGPAQTNIASRPVFQRFVGESDMRLRAARSRAVDCFEEAWQCACAGHVPDARLQAETRASSVFVTEVAIEIATQAFRYAGGVALQSSTLLQRYWRDVTAGGQHGAVNDEGYEAHGRFLLGIQPEQPPAGGTNVR